MTSLSPSLTPSCTETMTHTLTHRRTRTPASLSSPSKPWLAFSCCLFEWHFFRFCSLKHWNMSHSYPPKTNTSRCLLLYINSRPPVFTKCLFNENCFVSSLSEHLMAHVLLQVPETNRDIWPWKAEPRTKTKEHAHTHMYLHTLAHAHKHFPFQPHWVSSKSRSACN